MPVGQLGLKGNGQTFREKKTFTKLWKIVVNVGIRGNGRNAGWEFRVDGLRYRVQGSRSRKQVSLRIRDVGHKSSV